MDDNGIKENVNEVLFVSGQRGSGKSHWTKNYILKLPRVMVFDSLSEYTTEKTFYDIAGLVDFLKADQAKSSFFTASFDSYEDDDFPLFCRAMLAAGNMYVVIEEIDLFSSPTNTPVELLRLLKYGRHWNLQIIGVSRRPAEVSRSFTAMTTRFVIFSQREPRDIAYFRSVFGSEADKILQLKDYRFLDIDFKSQVYEIQEKV